MKILSLLSVGETGGGFLHDFLSSLLAVEGGGEGGSARGGRETVGGLSAVYRGGGERWGGGLRG